MKRNSVFGRYLRVLLSYITLVSFITFIVAVLLDWYTIAAYAVIVFAVALICIIFLNDDGSDVIPPFGYFGFWP